MIEKSIVLACTTEHAFALFTTQISVWWPPERRHTSDTASELFMLESGRFYERASGGREVELGRVRVWEPPSRLVLDFYPGTDSAHPTEVEVSFRSEAADGSTTRVTIQHRPTAASQALFAARAPRYVASWEAVLPALAKAAREPG